MLDYMRVLRVSFAAVRAIRKMSPQFVLLFGGKLCNGPCKVVENIDGSTWEFHADVYYRCAGPRKAYIFIAAKA